VETLHKGCEKAGHLPWDSPTGRSCRQVSTLEPSRTRRRPNEAARTRPQASGCRSSFSLNKMNGNAGLRERTGSPGGGGLSLRVQRLQCGDGRCHVTQDEGRQSSNPRSQPTSQVEVFRLRLSAGNAETSSGADANSSEPRGIGADALFSSHATSVEAKFPCIDLQG